LGAVSLMGTLLQVLKFGNGINQLPEIFDLGLLIHADDDIECVFDLCHEIHDSQTVKLQIIGKRRLVSNLDTFFIKRFN